MRAVELPHVAYAQTGVKQMFSCLLVKFILLMNSSELICILLRTVRYFPIV